VTGGSLRGARRSRFAGRLARSHHPCGALFETPVPLEATHAGALDGDAIRAAALEHGAALIRGLGLDGAAAFEAFARAVTPAVHAGYPELPRLAPGAACHRATPYPAALPIHFHNEAAHRRRWPRWQWFFAERVAEQGGRTLIADGRRVLAALRPALVDELLHRGLSYLRRFAPGLDVSPGELFGAADGAGLDQALRDEGARSETDGGRLRVRVERSAFADHPETGERLPFHQIFVHHPSRLPPSLRAALEAAGGPSPDYPRDVTWGDGARIPDPIVDELEAAYRAAAEPVAWRPGDVLLIDNLRVAHAREPFHGARSVLVMLAGVA
jgi:hypothetical protein